MGKPEGFLSGVVAENKVYVLEVVNPAKAMKFIERQNKRSGGIGNYYLEQVKKYQEKNTNASLREARLFVILKIAKKAGLNLYISIDSDTDVRQIKKKRDLLK